MTIKVGNEYELILSVFMDGSNREVPVFKRGAIPAFNRYTNKDGVKDALFFKRLMLSSIRRFIYDRPLDLNDKEGGNFPSSESIEGMPELQSDFFLKECAPGLSFQFIDLELLDAIEIQSLFDVAEEVKLFGIECILYMESQLAEPLNIPPLKIQYL